jgi:hypothetical protein
MRDARMMASWVLALFLIVMLLWIADQSLFGPPEKNVVFPTLRDKSQIYLWEPTGRYVIGLGHVLAALLLLVPWTRRLGAILAFLIAGGAVAAQFMWIGMAVPTSVGATTTDGGQLFYLTLALAVAALVLVVIHPGKDKAAGSGPHNYYGR